ncbi:uncharacterized protein LOC111088529 [Limulus polyphemus]|uniref:Uncharacterized protein LOC111088529 n=1 Tax=Limulus polyphemus TaxID=6850 RepID=A0ABM1TFK9_LIMPO|nr:uncharacterized protein LOC111088529 [Limulus polyphemus]
MDEMIKLAEQYMEANGESITGKTKKNQSKLKPEVADQKQDATKCEQISKGAIFFSVNEKKFNGHCPLYSDIVVVMVPGKNDSFRFVTDIYAEKRTKWGSSHSCNFCSFMLVASFVYGLTLIWFFCVCSGNGNIGAIGVPNPWRLIPPALLFTTLITVAMCASAFLLTMGMRHFCHQIETGPIGSCDAAQHIAWEAYPHMNGFYSLHLKTEAEVTR